MKISVVIPVYNVKPYLERCVSSVLGQTYKDVEIILVDDGSTDGSGELCDELASRYSLVTSVHQDNQGISGARNTGLLRAVGEYVAFLDSDDAWLLSDGLERLMLHTQPSPADVVIFKMVHINQDGQKSFIQDYDVEHITALSSVTVMFDYLVRTQQFNMSACPIIIRRNLLVENKIFFPLGIISEDVFWSLHLWQYIQSVVILNLDLYGYFHRDSSVSTSTTIRVYEDYDKILTYWKERCNEGCINASAIRIYLANLWVNRGYNYHRLQETDKPTALTILERHADLLDYAETPKALRVAWMVSHIGVRNTVLILGLYWRIRTGILG